MSKSTLINKERDCKGQTDNLQAVKLRAFDDNTTSVRKRVEFFLGGSPGSIGRNLMGSKVTLSAIVGDASVRFCEPFGVDIIGILVWINRVKDKIKLRDASVTVCVARSKRDPASTIDDVVNP